MPAIWTSRQPWVRRPSGLVTLNRGSGQARGLIAWCPLNGRATDQLGRRMTYAATWGNAFEPSPFGGFAWSNGTSADWAAINDAPAVTDGTVALWLKPDAAESNYGRFIDRDYLTGFWVGCIGSTFGGGFIAQASPYGSFVSLSAGQWHHLVVRRSGTTNVAYGNGGIVSGTPFASGSGAATNTGAIVLGADQSYGSSSKSPIADVAVWNRAISDAEIRALYDPRTRWELYQPIVKRSYFDMAGGAPPANVEGTGALTAGSATLSATGTLRVTATASVTATAATLSATGAQRHTATSALTVQAATTAATATQRNRATSTLTAGAATVTASGSVGSAITGTATLTATAAALAGTAGQTHRATSALSATGATLTASGTVGSAIVGTSVLTAPAATLAGTGAQAHRGTAALTAAAATLSGTGTVASGAVTGTATLSATAATLAAAATQTHYATATLTASAATIWASQSAVLAADADTWRARARPTAWRARSRPTAWKAKP